MRAGDWISAASIAASGSSSAESGLSKYAREQHLADLAPRGALGPDLGGQEIARDLLRDRRCTADDSLGAVVRPRRADDGAVVDAMMLEEADVLGSEHRV